MHKRLGRFCSRLEMISKLPDYCSIKQERKIRSLSGNEEESVVPSGEAGVRRSEGQAQPRCGCSAWIRREGPCRTGAFG